MRIYAPCCRTCNSGWTNRGSSIALDPCEWSSEHCGRRKRQAQHGNMPDIDVLTGGGLPNHCRCRMGFSIFALAPRPGAKPNSAGSIGRPLFLSTRIRSRCAYRTGERQRGMTSATTARIVPRSRRAWRAGVKKTRPAAGSTPLRPFQTNSLVPSSVSNWAIACDIADCVVFSSRGRGQTHRARHASCRRSIVSCAKTPALRICKP